MGNVVSASLMFLFCIPWTLWGEWQALDKTVYWRRLGWEVVEYYEGKRECERYLPYSQPLPDVQKQHPGYRFVTKCLPMGAPPDPGPSKKVR